MFKSVVSAVSEQRLEIKNALVLFPYFETWNPDLIAECCRVSSISEFPPGELILGPDTKNSHTVYFVLEGVCKMVRNLDVEVNVDSCQRVIYKLHKEVASRSFYTESKRDGYSSKLFNLMFQSQGNVRIAGESEVNAEVKDEPVVSTEEGGKTEVNRKMKDETEVAKEQQKNLEKNSLEAEKPPEMVGNLHENTSNTNIPSIANKPEDNTNSEKNSTVEETVPSTTIYEPDHHLKILEESKRRGKEKRKTFFSEKPPNVRSFFIEIGFLHRGACFGLEKFETENYILSEKTVRCLKIPEGFLLRHNPCNIWKRIRLFQSLYLPKDEKVFERFRTDRMWLEWKKKLTDAIAGKNLSNFTLICDVPYSVRLSELR